MSESQAETFTERVDVSTQPDGAFIGTLEIDVRPGNHQEERVRTLKDECDRLRDRVAGSLEVGEAEDVEEFGPEVS
jgi:hypothetical protein